MIDIFDFFSDSFHTIESLDFGVMIFTQLFY